MRNRYANPDDDSRGPYCAVDLTVFGSKPPFIYSWRDIMPPDGRSWRITRERAEALDADGRILWPARAGRPRLKQFLSEVDEGEDEAKEQPGFRSRIEIALRTALRVIAQEIARTPDALRIIEWRDLERVLREVFEGLGFETRLTRPGRDGGFDLELCHDDNGQLATYLVEVKHWAAPSRPGRAIISRFAEVVIGRTADRGLMLSSSGFSLDAVSGRSEVERQRVRLGDGEKIVALCQSYVRTGRGLWMETSTLPEVLFQATL